MDEPVRPEPAAAPDAAGPSSSGGPAATTTVAPGPTRRPMTSGIPPLTPRVLVLLIGAVVVGVALYFGRHSLGPFVVGLVLAYVLDVPVERMSRSGLPRWACVLLVYALVVVVFVVAIYVVVRPLADEVATFIREFPAFTAQVTDLYAHLELPPAVREAIDSWLANLGQGVGGITPSDLLPVVTGIAGVVGSIVGYMIVPVWVFYLIKDRPALAAAAERVAARRMAAGRAGGRRDSGSACSASGSAARSSWDSSVGVATFVGLEVLSLTVDPVFGRFAVLLSVDRRRPRAAADHRPDHRGDPGRAPRPDRRGRCRDRGGRPVHG